MCVPSPGEVTSHDRSGADQMVHPASLMNVRPSLPRVLRVGRVGL